MISDSNRPLTLTNVAHVEAVVLVEGESDKAAIETLAVRLGRELASEAVSIVVMGGASPLTDHLEDLVVRRQYQGLIAGLVDIGETRDLDRGLSQVGLPRDGFFICDPDLEGEMIRALGPGAIEAIFQEQGELGRFRTFQNQPQWRGQPIEEQMHRFFGTKSRRKLRYGSLLAEAVPMDQIPVPLQSLLDYV